MVQRKALKLLPQKLNGLILGRIYTWLARGWWRSTASSVTFSLKALFWARLTDRFWLLSFKPVTFSRHP